MVSWFRSFLTPLIVMIAIPFSLVGILPAHGIMGAFFSATSMIGFMAGGGIVVRNSIILVDFIQLRVREGMPLSEAVIDAGAVRFRPMLLTAMAVVAGASVILADPIFQGLANWQIDPMVPALMEAQWASAAGDTARARTAVTRCRQELKRFYGPNKEAFEKEIAAVEA